MWPLMFKVTKPPTTQEFAVIFWTFALILAAFGVVCLVYGYRAPAEKAAEAHKLIRGGWTMVIAGVALPVGYCLTGRAIDWILARI